VSNHNVPELPAQIGWDDVRFGYQKDPRVEEGIVIKKSIIGEIADNKFFWVGVFGLDPRLTNLSDLDGMNNPQRSLIARLKDTSAVPSRSWAYTAGSKYSKFHSTKTLSLFFEVF